MLGFIFYPDLLSRGFPFYEPAKSHPLFESHRIFLQQIPQGTSRVEEGKVAVSSSSSSRISFKEASQKFYQMIQERDTSIEYRKPTVIAEKNFLDAFDLFCEYEKEVGIEKKKAYYLFLKILYYPIILPNYHQNLVQKLC